MAIPHTTRLIKEPIEFQLGYQPYDIGMISWSPNDTYLLLAYKGNNNCHIKIYELRGDSSGTLCNRSEDWQFNFDKKENPLANVIQHAIWSPDEKTLLLHPCGTNQLHMMRLNSQGDDRSAVTSNKSKKDS
jgi:hypothetical protein